MITKSKNVKNISIIVPIYNEEKYIEKCINSILNQDYEKKYIEIIFVDGKSEDNSKKIITELLSKKKINYKLIDNPKRITAISINLGIKYAKNEIIMRMDAHSEYPNNYISKCVYYLNNTDADNVGCLIETIGEGKKGKCIESILTSKFGVGNSGFRTKAKKGYVETVPFGTFRKELVDIIGYYNEKLIRSEDNEFNFRIIKNKGKIFLFDDISVIYRPRNTYADLFNMAFKNGEWILYTSKIMPGSMKLRHFIPMFFVLGIIIGIFGILLKVKAVAILFLICLGLYFLLDGYFTAKHIKDKGLYQVICMIVYPIFHISYGIGTIVGIKKVLKYIGG